MSSFAPSATSAFSVHKRPLLSITSPLKFKKNEIEKKNLNNNIKNINNITYNNIFNTKFINKLKIFDTSKFTQYPISSILSDDIFIPILQLNNAKKIIIQSNSNSNSDNSNSSKLINYTKNTISGGYSDIYTLNDGRILKIVRNPSDKIVLQELKAILFNLYLQGLSDDNINYICNIDECGYNINTRQLYCVMQNCGTDLLFLPNKIIELYKLKLSRKLDKSLFISYKNLIEIIKTLLNIFNKCAKAINFIHKNGYIHNDIKPDNFMFTFNEDSNEFNIKIIDFGLFNKLDSKIIHPKGTREYLNYGITNNIKKDSTYKVKYDIYSLGRTFIILYEAIMKSLNIDIYFNNININNIDSNYSNFNNINYKIYMLFTKMITPNIENNNKKNSYTYIPLYDTVIIEKFNKLKQYISSTNPNLNNLINSNKIIRYPTLDSVINDINNIIKNI